MKRSRVGRLLCCVALLVVSFGCDRVPGGSQQTVQELRNDRALARCKTMQKLLPDTAKLAGRLNYYIHSDMPALLTDESDTFERFGVVGALQAKLIIPGSELDLRLFDVQTPERAYALYLWLSPGATDKGAEAVQAGNESVLTTGLLRCWKGMHLIEVRGALDAPETRTAAEALARSIADNITEAGQPSPAVTALRKVLTTPPPSDLKVIYGEAELMTASIVVPYYSGDDPLNLEKDGEKHLVEATLASVPMSEATPGQTVFFIVRYPTARDAVAAHRKYVDMAKPDPNFEIKNAVLIQEGDVLGGVWRPVRGAEDLLKKALAELKQ